MAEQAVLISAGFRHLGCELKKDKACLMTDRVPGEQRQRVFWEAWEEVQDLLGSLDKAGSHRLRV